MLAPMTATLPATWLLTLIGPTLTSEALAAVAGRLQAHGWRELERTRLSRGALHAECWRLLPSGRDGHALRAELLALRAELLALHADWGLDAALQPEVLVRQPKRLAVMDMDSTLIQQEVIDELARLCGVFDRVAAITHRAMNGELDFDGALRERVRLLAGAPESVLSDVLAHIEPTPGAARLVRALRLLGCTTAVVSGGFTRIAEPIRQQLGLDLVFANELEIRDGRLTGEVIGPIVNRQRKAELLEAMAAERHIPLAQVMAIGDGANDLDMLDRAGLGVAFCAKPVVRAQAGVALNHPRLDAVLYLMGMSDADVASLGAEVA
jgi:phosphoserine phosphatase